MCVMISRSKRNAKRIDINREVEKEEESTVGKSYLSQEYLPQ